MTASWVDETWLALDTETTGIDVFADRIVEVAVVEVHPDGTTGDAYSTIVDPGVEIPDGAAKVHGITTARARDEGISPANALASVAARIFAHGYRPVIMYNATFDWPLAISEAERHGVEFPAIAPVLDPHRIDHLVDRYRKGSRKLVDVARHYAVPFAEDEAHGALADAVAAARVMRAIVARHPQVGERSLASVYLRQVRGHEIWRENFVGYKRRTDPTFDIPPGWPIPADIRPAGLPVLEPRRGIAAGSTAAGSGDSTAPAPTAHPATRPDEGAVSPTAPSPGPRGLAPADVGRLAGVVFRKDYDAAPHGDKSKVVERLRHALTYGCTAGRATSLNDLTPDELLVVDRWLRHIRDELVHYATDPDGVTFVLVSTGEEHAVAWADLEHHTAA